MRGYMQFVKYAGEIPQTDKTLRFSGDSGPESNTGNWTRWIPVALLAGTFIAILTLGTSDKPGEELDWLSRLSNEGDTGAQLQLGLAYRDGHYGLKPDQKTAFYWLQKAANNGDAFAEDAVGSAYARGMGVQKNQSLAEQWWHKAARDGSKDARVHLAESLLRQNHQQEAERLLLK